MAYARVTQAVAYALAIEGAPARVTQAVAYVIATDSTSGGPGTDGETCPESILFGGLKTRVLTMLGEDTAAPVYWSSDEIGRYINDVYSDVCLDSKALEYIEVLAVTSGSATAQMSQYVSQVRRMTWGDRSLSNVTKYEMDRIDSNWESRSGYVDRYITGQYDDRTVGFYQKWDGTADYCYNVFFEGGAYTYTDWLLGDVYAVDARTKHDYASATGNKVAYICILAHTASATTEPGVGATWTTYWVPLNAAVWAIKNPTQLVASTDEPELPAWCHMGLAYGAAARALSKYGEQQNKAVAGIYQAMADEYWGMLKAMVANKMPERTVSMGRAQTSRGVRPYPWPPAVTTS